MNICCAIYWQFLGVWQFLVVCYGPRSIAWEIGVYGLHSSDASESGERHTKCGKCRADLSTGAKEESSRMSP